MHLLGVAYKKDVSDMRESPALDILELLHRRGAGLSYTDPYVPPLDPRRGVELMSVPECEASAGPGLRGDLHQPLGVQLPGACPHVSR